jgi:hypothetical protein
MYKKGADPYFTKFNLQVFHFVAHEIPTQKNGVGVYLSILGFTAQPLGN